MWKFKEEQRKKDFCITCKIFKPIKAKSMCQNCWHKVKRKTNPKFFLSTRYTEIVQRCSNPKNTTAKYYNGLDYCTREQFIKKFLKDINFNKLFKQWKSKGYKIKYTPSIDRIDKNKGYTINNIQCITHSENCLKDQVKCPVDVYNKKGKKLYTFISQNEASRQLDIPQANIWKVLNGKRKHAGGLSFKYAKS